MRADADAPLAVAHRVVHALAPRVALRLHGVAGQRADGRRRVAQAHVHGVGRVAEVEGARQSPALRRPARRWRRRQAETRRRQRLAGRFKGDDGQAVR